jgi:hypothetical protein
MIVGVYVFVVLPAFRFLPAPSNPTRPIKTLRPDQQHSHATPRAPNPEPRRGSMAAAGWLRRAAAVSLPRLPSGLPLIPPPPSGPLTEAQSLVVPGLGAAAGPAMELMAVPKKKVRFGSHPLDCLWFFLLHRFLVLDRCGLVLVLVGSRLAGW